MLSDVRDFVTAIFAGTGSGLCGSVAAGLAIASPFVEPDAAQAMFFAGSALACSAMGFLLWRRERRGATVAARSPRRPIVDGQPGRQDERIGGSIAIRAAAAGEGRTAPPA